ncbi:HTH-type transcriptional repressor RspR [Methylobacterium crusticola]|uniref:HTH-type transcriptional repressor RspR n=1 Tax=Methylobacterium crusticola TaxID=1697972 RepID=A0ABQ4R3E8_9HYPH|nr:GntR family transcriptional regulator [Methylobacterium crusticola]GJD52167.1 HTH-type transcriptional repressor RspR [Methylobacterium crusticola]
MTDAIPFKGKAPHAYRELKRRILTFALEPGQLLNEADLVDELALGRTPIREAIQRLAAEKLVVARPRQTPFVAPILAHELAEIVEIRLVLEVPAARLAAERGSAQQRERLGMAGTQFREHAGRPDDGTGILTSDAAIHGLIAAMSRNTFMADYAERLASFSQRIWWLSVQNTHRDEGFVRCHDELIATVCAGDVNAAGRAAEAHVELFRTRLGRLLQVIPTGAVTGEAPLRPDRSAPGSA